MYNNNNKDYGDLIEQARENQPFTYEEYLDFLDGYKEVSFYYQGLEYGATLGYHPGEDFRTVDFFRCDEGEDKIVVYKGLDDFAANAKIDGKLLRDIWPKVTKVYFLD